MWTQSTLQESKAKGHVEEHQIAVLKEAHANAVLQEAHASTGQHIKVKELSKEHGKEHVKAHQNAALQDALDSAGSSAARTSRLAQTPRHTASSTSSNRLAQTPKTSKQDAKTPRGCLIHLSGVVKGLAADNAIEC